MDGWRSLKFTMEVMHFKINQSGPTERSTPNKRSNDACCPERTREQSGRPERGKGARCDCVHRDGVFICKWSYAMTNGSGSFPFASHVRAVDGGAGNSCHGLQCCCGALFQDRHMDVVQNFDSGSMSCTYKIACLFMSLFAHCFLHALVLRFFSFWNLVTLLAFSSSSNVLSLLNLFQTFQLVEHVHS